MSKEWAHDAARKEVPTVNEVVVARPRMQLQKYPFTTHGAGINGAKSGPHRAWDPV